MNHSINMKKTYRLLFAVLVISIVIAFIPTKAFAKRQRDDSFFAVLSWYYTRSNVFEVVFYNVGDVRLEIVSGIKVVDVDYKTFDRRIRLKKKVVIKPHKQKTVRFHVIGRPTWYDYSDFTLYYKFKQYGKTYEGHVWDEESVFKSGKRWPNTYWDERVDEYYDWASNY